MGIGKIIIAILVFGVIVLIHEAGHFLAARLCGVKVQEFCIGMGPQLFVIHGKKTDYSLRCLPFGGACMMKGEDEEDQAGEGDDDSFQSKKPWQRFLIVAAGPLSNFILALIAAMIIVGNIGSDLPVIAGVMDGYPAQEAGIEAGDTIVRIGGSGVKLYREVTLYTSLHPGYPADITVRKPDGSKSTVRIVPKYDEESGRYLFGMLSSSGYTKPANVFQLLICSWYEFRYNIKSTIDSLIYLLSGRASANDLMGPVGIVTTVGDAVEQTYSYGLRIMLLTILDFLLLLSANIGVVNLLPLPALDGGRLLFILIEIIAGKPVNRKVESYIHAAGITILMVLMVFIMFNDIRRLFF